MRRKLGQCQRRVRNGSQPSPAPSSPAKPHRFGVFQYVKAARITDTDFLDGIDTEDTLTGSLKGAYQYEGDDE